MTQQQSKPASVLLEALGAAVLTFGAASVTVAYFAWWPLLGFFIGAGLWCVWLVWRNPPDQVASPTPEEIQAEEAAKRAWLEAFKTRHPRLGSAWFNSAVFLGLLLFMTSFLWWPLIAR